MVLQTENPSLFGWATPGGTVTATLGGESKSSTAASDGKWLIRLSDRAASFTPVSITVSHGAENLTLDDVLFGDVWVCGGQVRNTVAHRSIRFLSFV
jgi:sialate O-acetylesterase